MQVALRSYVEDEGTNPARLHEFNSGFHWDDCHESNRFISDDQARDFDELGYFVIENALSSRTTNFILDTIDPIEARWEKELRKLHGGKFSMSSADEMTVTAQLAAESDILRQFANSLIFTDLCSDLIGPDVRLYWDEANYKKARTAAPVPWHQDNGGVFVDPQQFLTCWIALTDSTEENGCLWVVPGLHRQGTLAHEQTEAGFTCFQSHPEAIPVPVRRGSIIVLSSLTPQCTGFNRSREVNKSYALQFVKSGSSVVYRDSDGAPKSYLAYDPDRQFEILSGYRRVDEVHEIALEAISEHGEVHSGIFARSH